MYFKVIKIYEDLQKQFDSEYSCTFQKTMQNVRTQRKRSVAEIEKPQLTHKHQTD
jgi:hypothetical protein